MANLVWQKSRVQMFLYTAVLIIGLGDALVASNEAAVAQTNPMQPSSPHQSTMTRLSERLQEYKQLAAKGGWPKFTVGKTVKPGEIDNRIPVLREMLVITGDFTGAQDIGSTTLDAPLVEALKSFQDRHGLDTDGALGKKTQAALAVPVTERVAQMQATLERMQTMPDQGNKYILVNVPGFYLNAVENGQIAMTSRVIVGSPRNATPLFNQPITDVSFNPAWNVPPRIARNEMMPKLKNNPEYFARSNFVVTDHQGERVDPSSIDWENGASSYRFQQRPGSGNALGKVKFNLPNTDNVYLHSTAKPALFAQADRALSHGCIRVEMARELAHFVMAGLSDWHAEKVNQMYDSSNSKIVRVEPLQVYLAYWTSFISEDGKLHFHQDIYGKDRSRVAELLRDAGDVKVAMNVEQGEAKTAQQ